MNLFVNWNSKSNLWRLSDSNNITDADSQYGLNLLTELSSALTDDVWQFIQWTRFDSLILKIDRFSRVCKCDGIFWIRYKIKPDCQHRNIPWKNISVFHITIHVAVTLSNQLPVDIPYNYYIEVIWEPVGDRLSTN